ncbi:MAG: hypothetical protein AAFR59_08860, partial [Bacteroidota bacterium]
CYIWFETDQNTCMYRVFEMEPGKSVTIDLQGVRAKDTVRISERPVRITRYRGAQRGRLPASVSYDTLRTYTLKDTISRYQEFLSAKRGSLIKKNELRKEAQWSMVLAQSMDTVGPAGTQANPQATRKLPRSAAITLQSKDGHYLTISPEGKLAFVAPDAIQSARHIFRIASITGSELKSGQMVAIGCPNGGYLMASSKKDEIMRTRKVRGKGNTFQFVLLSPEGKLEDTNQVAFISSKRKYLFQKEGNMYVGTEELGREETFRMVLMEDIIENVPTASK